MELSVPGPARIAVVVLLILTPIAAACGDDGTAPPAAANLVFDAGPADVLIDAAMGVDMHVAAVGPFGRPFGMPAAPSGSD